MCWPSATVAGKERRPQNHQPAHFFAVILLQIPARHRGRDPPAGDAGTLRGACAPAIGLPDGESVIDYRDRAILKTFLRSGIHLGTADRSW